MVSHAACMIWHSILCNHTGKCKHAGHYICLELYACESIGELNVALEEIRQSIPASMLHKYFDNMDCRMKQVFNLNGDYIGM